jgi:hypothetical protein
MSTPSNPAENEQKKNPPPKKQAVSSCRYSNIDFYDPFLHSAETSNQTGWCDP